MQSRYFEIDFLDPFDSEMISINKYGWFYLESQKTRVSRMRKKRGIYNQLTTEILNTPQR
jgi:hypothetical protein